MRTPAWLRRKSAPNKRPAVSAFGFCRVEQVCIIEDGPRSFAEVTGITHRYPRTIRVPLGAVTRLVAAGVPCRFESPVAAHGGAA